MSTDTNTLNPNATAGAAAVELRQIALADIAVEERFNPRGEVLEDAELLVLAETIRQRGCLQPIRVRQTETGGYVVIAGERRYRAAVLADLTEIPAAIVPAGAGGEGERVELLVDAMIENELRSELNPLQRAQGYQAMLDRGLSVRGVAERLGGKTRRAGREQRIKEHLAILALPEDLRALVAAEKVPLLAIKALVYLCTIHEGLARSAVAAVLDATEGNEPYTWGEIVDEPLAIAVTNLPDMPAGLYNTAHSYPLECFTLGEKAQKDLAAFERLTGAPIQAIRFTPELREQAAVLGAVHDCGWFAIIAGQDVGDRLAEDYIAARLKAERTRNRQTQTQANTPSPDRPAADREPAAHESAAEREERVRQDVQAEREAEKQRRELAVAYNLELGVLAFKHLAKVKVDERVLRILASVDMGGSLRGIASRGARLTLPGWVTQTTNANASTKTAYLDDHDATGKALEFLQGANSAGDIAGRALILIALALLADEQAIAQSRRSYYTLTFHGAWAAQARADLHSIVRERIKEGQLPALDQALAEGIAVDEADAHLQDIIRRVEQLSESELEEALADAEQAWGAHGLKTHKLKGQIKAERERRNSLDTITERDEAGEQDDQPQEIPAAA